MSNELGQVGSHIVIVVTGSFEKSLHVGNAAMATNPVDDVAN